MLPTEFPSVLAPALIVTVQLRVGVDVAGRLAGLGCDNVGDDGVQARFQNWIRVENEQVRYSPDGLVDESVIPRRADMLPDVPFPGGDSIEDVLADYPSLSAEDLPAVFAFAGSLARFEDIPYESAGVAL